MSNFAQTNAQIVDGIMFDEEQNPRSHWVPERMMGWQTAQNILAFLDVSKFGGDYETVTGRWRKEAFEIVEGFDSDNWESYVPRFQELALRIFRNIHLVNSELDDRAIEMFLI